MYPASSQRPVYALPRLSGRPPIGISSERKDVIPSFLLLSKYPKSVSASAKSEYSKALTVAGSKKMRINENVTNTRFDLFIIKMILHFRFFFSHI